LEDYSEDVATFNFLDEGEEKREQRARRQEEEAERLGEREEEVER